MGQVEHFSKAKLLGKELIMYGSCMGLVFL